jgi:hypothetical protein
LDSSFYNNGLNKEIFISIRNLVKQTDRIIDKGVDRLAHKNSQFAEEVDDFFFFNIKTLIFVHGI